MIDEIRELLEQAENIVFMTGAGVSAESGLPTYRGVGGLYEGKKTAEGMDIEEALSGITFEQDPGLSWKYLWQVGKACVGAQANAAHKIIADIEASKENVLVLTQNVDGLHRAAGSKNLIEIHGHAFDLFCVSCGERYNAHELLNDFEGKPQLPPKCHSCDGVIRPDVVLFGEMLPYDAISAFDYLRSNEPDMIFCVGTSGLFPYIAEPVYRARHTETITVEINPKKTDISGLFDYVVRHKAGEALARLWPKKTM